MKGKRTAWVAAAAALLAYAVPARAVDFYGYFRDSIAGNSRGGAQACFKTPGMDYKLRLGNECDAYAEWGFEQSIWKDKAGTEFKVGFMFDYFPSVMGNTGEVTDFAVQQGYVKVKFPQWGGMQAWAGKQYYRRENIDMIDFFYLNTSEPGVGVEDVDLGFGKMAASVFATKSAGTVVNANPPGSPAGSNDFAYAYWRPDIRVYGIPFLWQNSSIELDANAVIVSKNKDVADLSPNQATAGFWVTAEHTQEALMGGSNKLAVQWANGPAAQQGPGAPAFGADPLNKDNMQFRVLDQLLLQPSLKFQTLIGGMVQWKTQFVGTGAATSKQKFTQWGVFGRPVYYLSDYFKLQGDIGYTQNKPENGDAANLFKLTFAPTLSPSPGEKGGFFVRPEIRLFVTYANWNDTAAAVPAPNAVTNVPFGTEKNMVSYGMSVETWF